MMTPWYASLSSAELKRKIRYYESMAVKEGMSKAYRLNALQLVESMKELVKEGEKKQE